MILLSLLLILLLRRQIVEVENKLADIAGLVAAPALNTKVTKIENKIYSLYKYIITLEFNKFSSTISN